MLQRPADAPPPLGRVGDTDAVRAVRRAPGRPAAPGAAGHRPWRVSVRSWASKASGRASRRRLSEVVGAADALAAQCDALTDHVTALEAVTADLASTLGEEVARLRAEVAHLRRLLQAPHDPAPGPHG